MEKRVAKDIKEGVKILVCCKNLWIWRDFAQFSSILLDLALLGSV